MPVCLKSQPSPGQRGTYFVLRIIKLSPSVATSWRKGNGVRRKRGTHVEQISGFLLLWGWQIGFSKNDSLFSLSCLAHQGGRALCQRGLSYNLRNLHKAGCWWVSLPTRLWAIAGLSPGLVNHPSYPAQSLAGSKSSKKPRWKRGCVGRREGGVTWGSAATSRSASRRLQFIHFLLWAPEGALGMHFLS